VCATDEPVEENTVDLPEDHDGVEVRKAGSKRPASKKVQQEGRKRVRSVQIKASKHKHSFVARTRSSVFALFFMRTGHFTALCRCDSFEFLYFKSLLARLDVESCGHSHAGRDVLQTIFFTVVCMCALCVCTCIYNISKNCEAFSSLINVK
jgi:hypothetical protein